MSVRQRSRYRVEWGAVLRNLGVAFYMFVMQFVVSTPYPLGLFMTTEASTTSQVVNAAIVAVVSTLFVIAFYGFSSYRLLHVNVLNNVEAFTNEVGHAADYHAKVTASRDGAAVAAVPRGGPTSHGQAAGQHHVRRLYLDRSP